MNHDVSGGMMDLLRDSLWQFVGALIALAALLATLLIAALQRERRRLVYDLREFLPLVSVRHDQLRDRLQVLFDGQPIRDVYLIVLRLANAGNRPIKPSDFIKPLRFDFGPAARVLDAQITKQTPSNLGASVDTENSELVIAPLLLNRRDNFVLRAFVAAPTRVLPNARIVETEVVTEARRHRLQFGTVIIGAFIGVTLIIFSHFIKMGSAESNWLPDVISNTGTAFIVAGIATFLYEWSQHAREAIALSENFNDLRKS